MRKTIAVSGSALFFAIAPSSLAGLVPWWMTRWEFRPPFFELDATRAVGILLIVAGSGPTSRAGFRGSRPGEPLDAGIIRDAAASASLVEDGEEMDDVAADLALMRRLAEEEVADSLLDPDCARADGRCPGTRHSARDHGRRRDTGGTVESSSGRRGKRGRRAAHSSSEPPRTTVA